MTDSRQHSESTMLQPCRTAAAVGDTMYVRIMACPRYAAGSCLCRSRSFVTPPYHIFLLCCCLNMSIDRAIVSATSPGLGFPHPPSPCTYVRFGQALFSARNFSVFLREDRR